MRLVFRREISHDLAFELIERNGYCVLARCVQFLFVISDLKRWASTFGQQRKIKTISCLGLCAPRQGVKFLAKSRFQSVVACKNWANIVNPRYIGIDRLKNDSLIEVTPGEFDVDREITRRT